MASAAGAAAATPKPGAGGDSTLMFLKPENKILEEDLRKRLDPERAGPAAPADIRVGDFDGAWRRRSVTRLVAWPLANGGRGAVCPGGNAARAGCTAASGA
jgi:hypothetical protein